MEFSTENNFIHPSSIVEEGAHIGAGVSVWHFCHVRSGAKINDLVSLGKDVYVDSGVEVGRGSRVQNGVSLYKGISISEWCFIGPNVTFTNDPYPRAGLRSWNVENTILGPGAAVGAGAIIRCGVTLEAFSLVGAGAIVTRSVPAFHLALGLPARPINKICACGKKQSPLSDKLLSPFSHCCKKSLLPEVYELAQKVFNSLSTEGQD